MNQKYTSQSIAKFVIILVLSMQFFQYSKSKSNFIGFNLKQISNIPIKLVFATILLIQEIKLVQFF